MEEKEKSSTAGSSTEPAGGGSWWGSWGQDWIETVKEKSAVTLEMVKKDLNEFVDVIQGDTSTAISETAAKIEKKSEDTGGEEDTANKAVKKGMEGLSKFLHSVSELMAIEPDDTQEELITLSDDKYSLQGYDRKQEKLHSIQTDPGTYCNEPEGLYKDWLQIFNLDDHKTEMSEMLVQNPAIRGIYTQLVPAVLSHTIFWQRYFYQIFLLDAEEKKREELLARANDASSKDETDGGWGEDDDDDIEVLTQSIPTMSGDAPTMSSDVPTSDHSPSMDDREIDDVLTLEKGPSSDTKDITGEKVVIVNETLPESVEIDKCSDDDNKNKVIINEPSAFSMTRVIQTKESTKETCEISESLAEISIDEFKKDACNPEHTKTMKTTAVSSEQTLDKSCDTIKTENEFTNELEEGKQIKTDNELTEDLSCENSPSKGSKAKYQNNSRLQLVQDTDVKHEYSETSSISSWISIDEDMKVKKIKGEQEIKQDTNGNSEGKSSHDSEVLINKSDADGLDDDDDDFDLELDDDVNEEELAKLVEEIKNKSASGKLQDDDDDWENWE